MLNQCILVGKLESFEEEKDIINLNIQGEIIPVSLSHDMLKNTMEYLKKDSTLGIKAKLKMIDSKVIVIGEKMTFINTK